MDQLNRFTEHIAAGHTKKAEKVLRAIIWSHTIADLSELEDQLRGASNAFLPHHKARHTRINELITSRLKPTPVRVAYLDSSLTSNDTRRHYHESVYEVEYRMLVQEIRPLNYAQSEQVRQYIIQNELGRKYSHISGILKLRKNGEIFDYPYAIAPKYYGRLCRELGLGNKNSGAVPESFTSWSDFSSPEF